MRLHSLSSAIVGGICASTRFLTASENVSYEEKNKFVFVFEIVGVVVCLLLCAVFSGLNLGLLALDRINLKILYDLGNDIDRKRVKKIMRVRKNGNVLLCTLLIGNGLIFNKY
jgi:metal transporter CNNM